MFLDVWGGCSKATGQNEGGPADCALRSAAPPQVAPRAKFQIKVLANIYEAKSVIFKSPGLDLVLPPLYLSPGPRTFRRAGPKIRESPTWTVFFWILRPSKTHFQNDIEKSLKKMRKSWFWASQNRPKILPKCLQK